MRFLWFSLLVLFAMPNVLAEPQLAITPDTVVTSSLLLQWFHGQDPRLVAWASDFARRRHDDIVIREMPAWLEGYVNLPLRKDSPQLPSEQYRAASAVLDTLIQEKVQVPVTTIEAVAESFPAQAAVLISRLPIDQSRETLGEWSMSKDGNRGTQDTARSSGMKNISWA